MYAGSKTDDQQLAADIQSAWEIVGDSKQLLNSTDGHQAVLRGIRHGRGQQLERRPVAFRVPRADPATGGATISATEWRLFNDEGEARDAADALGVEYEGLYARRAQ